MNRNILVFVASICIFLLLTFFILVYKHQKHEYCIGRREVLAMTVDYFRWICVYPPPSSLFLQSLQDVTNAYGAMYLPCPEDGEYSVYFTNGSIRIKCTKHRNEDYEYPTCNSELYCKEKSLCSALDSWCIAPKLKFTNLEKAISLIEQRCNIDEQESTGKTPLMLSLAFGFDEIALLLINRGADIQIKDDLGRNALYYALRFKKDSVAEKLVGLGIDTTGVDKYGRSYLNYSLAYNCKKITKYLLTQNVDYNAPLTNIIDQREDFMPSFLNYRVDMATSVCEGFEGATPLMLAAFNGDVQIVALLLQKGADITAEDKSGATALDYAKKTGNAEIIKMLMKAGAKGGRGQ